MHTKARIKGYVIILIRPSGNCLLTLALLIGLRGLVLFAGLVLCWYCLDKWRRTSLLNFLERDLDSFGDELLKGAGEWQTRKKYFTINIKFKKEVFLRFSPTGLKSKGNSQHLLNEKKFWPSLASWKLVNCYEGLNKSEKSYCSQHRSHKWLQEETRPRKWPI